MHHMHQLWKQFRKAPLTHPLFSLEAAARRT